MRAFAITGMVTASWISRILVGSAIRATPPSRRMSAGTRSSAITAQAPASSAIRAWSASVTSMITPPLSISARPLLTRIVPISAMAGSLALRLEAEPVGDPAAGVDRVAVQPLRCGRDVEKAVLDPGARPHRIGGRAAAQRIETRAAAAVDDVCDAVPGHKSLVVVVVAGQDELDAVALEERNPAFLDVLVSGVPTARVRRMVEDRDPPDRTRSRELVL